MMCISTIPRIRKFPRHLFFLAKNKFTRRKKNIAIEKNKKLKDRKNAVTLQEEEK
jgi:hypothetical protein